MSLSARAYALALVVLIGAGCGSTAPSKTTSSSTTTARQKAVKFSECMRTHGVSDFPDPNAKNDFDYGISVSAAVWNKAVNACKALQPPGTLSGHRTAK